MPDFERWCGLPSSSTVIFSWHQEVWRRFCKRFLSTEDETEEEQKSFNWHHYMSHGGLNNCSDIWCLPKIAFIAQSYFLLNFPVMLSFFASLCVKFTVQSLFQHPQWRVLCDTCSSSVRALSGSFAATFYFEITYMCSASILAIREDNQRKNVYFRTLHYALSNEN